MFKNMTTSLLIHDRIQTTNSKAKELRKYVERMITLARKVRGIGDGDGDKNLAAKGLHYRRQALKYLNLPGIDAGNPDDRAERKELMDKLFVDLADRFAKRNGGYTRVLKVGNRRGDGAPLSIIEFVGELEEKEDKSSKKKSKKGKSPKAKDTQAPVETAGEEPVKETTTKEMSSEEIQPEPEAEKEKVEKKEEASAEPEKETPEKTLEEAPEDDKKEEETKE